MGFAEAMLIEYNKRARGTALRFDILHSHRASKHMFPSESTHEEQNIEGNRQQPEPFQAHPE